MPQPSTQMKMRTLKLIAVYAAAIGLAGGTLNVNAGGTNDAEASPKRSENPIPAGSVKLHNVELSLFLPIYSDLAEAEVDSSKLRKLPVLISFENTNAVSRAELVKLLDKTLYDRGIVATHVDKKHVVLSYRSEEKKK